MAGKHIVIDIKTVHDVGVFGLDAKRTSVSIAGAARMVIGSQVTDTDQCSAIFNLTTDQLIALHSQLDSQLRVIREREGVH